MKELQNVLILRWIYLTSHAYLFSAYHIILHHGNKSENSQASTVRLDFKYAI